MLLVKREENFASFLSQPMWMSWLAPLLAQVAKASAAAGGGDGEAARDDDESEYLKYIMNLFAMILYNAFCKGDNIDKARARACCCVRGDDAPRAVCASAR